MAEKSKLNYGVFKRLIAFRKQYRTLFGLALTFTLILAFLSPTRPILLMKMVEVFKEASSSDSEIMMWALFVLVLLLFEGVFQFFSSYFSNLFAQSIIRDLRIRLMDHILSFRMQYFDKTPIGALVTRLVSDLEAITEVFSSGLMNIISDLLMILVVIVAMFVVDWQLAILTLVPIPLLIFATRIFARFIRQTLQQEREAVNNLNVFVQERLTGMSLVQLFNRQKQEFEDFKTINGEHRQAHINAVWAYSIFFPVVELLSSLSVALLVVYAAMVVQGRTAAQINDLAPVILSFTLWIHMLYRPIRQMADRFNILQKGTVRAERVFAVLDRVDNIQDKGSLQSCDFDQDIRFEHLYFAYDQENWVLKDINLVIESGKTTAFVGATGAGKSSIVNLIGRFYEFQKGGISIGNVDIKDLELAYLRRNIAIVLQDVFLFSDSILNNITLGDNSITEQDVIAASKAVGAHEFISKLPDGYHYQVGERGGVLSTGQRQLLSFIRAYVYNPHILILDEATASVDNESEELIQKATEKLTSGRTSIVIAHRLSTIQKADQIVVLDRGEIKEIGKHNELLKKDNGYYRKLYDMQFSELEK